MRQKISRWQFLFVTGLLLVLVWGLWGTSGSPLSLSSVALAENNHVAATGNDIQPGTIVTSEVITSFLADLPPGTSGQTLRHDGTNWIADGLLFNNGTNIGIGTTSPTSKLDVEATGGTAVYGKSNNDGTAVYGESSGWESYGVYGKVNCGSGPWGESADNYAVYGENACSGTVGYLGGGETAVYGSSDYWYAGQFDGKVKVNGPLNVYDSIEDGTAVFGESNGWESYGVYGKVNPGSGPWGESADNYAVYGENSSSGTVGYLGGGETAVYGSSANWYAGQFDGKVKVNGSLATAFITKTADYMATAHDSVIAVDASSAAVTITLPTALGIEGREYTIKKAGRSRNAVIVDGNGSETIDGAATYRLPAPWKYVTVVSDGTNWLIVGNN